jgi:clan AA aspartic protease
MIGFVDDEERALLQVPMTASVNGVRQEIAAWIDTAFNGGFVLPREVIHKLNLIKESSTEAILADGNTVELETYACVFEWFGETFETQVIANEGVFPLLGTQLLSGRRLHIDYHTKTVELF